MEMFQGFFLQLAEAHANSPLAPVAKEFLIDRLNKFVSRRKPPDHPPYSAMIERALMELNEKRGSSETSISQHLEKIYDSLPAAHTELLKHHLKKLCESGDIIVTRAKRYLFVGVDQEANIGTKGSGKKLRGKNRNKQRFKKQSVRKDGVNIKKRKKSDEEATENGWQGEKKRKKEENQIQVRQPEIAKTIICISHANELRKTEFFTPETSPGYESVTPERPPGFESVIVENSEEVKPPPVDESKRAIRQWKRWSRRRLSENPYASVKQDSPCDDHDNEPSAEDASESELWVRTVPAEASNIKRYCSRKRKTREQNSSAIVVNEEEHPKKLQGPRRSVRIFMRKENENS